MNLRNTHSGERLRTGDPPIPPRGLPPLAGNDPRVSRHPPMPRGNFDSAHEEDASVTSGGSSKRSWSVNRPSAIERMREAPTSPPPRGHGAASESGRTDSSAGSWMRRGERDRPLDRIDAPKFLPNRAVCVSTELTLTPSLTFPPPRSSQETRAGRRAPPGYPHSAPPCARPAIRTPPRLRSRRLERKPRDSSSPRMRDSRSRPSPRRWRDSR